jgi:hypothetical protein
MLQREKFERENSGGYELIYPLITYEEEFEILSGARPIPIAEGQSNIDSTLDENGNPISDKSP